MVLTTDTVQATRAFGARVAAIAAPGNTFALEGGLGAGKTEFVRGFVAALDPSIIVRSPSFSIVNTYNAPAFPVFHFDFYRLSDSSELTEIGFDDYLAGNGVCIIEWATMFPDSLPADTRLISITDTCSTQREITWNFALEK